MNVSTPYFYQDISTPVGIISLVVSDDGVHVVGWGPTDVAAWQLRGIIMVDDEHRFLEKAEIQLGEYFRGERHVFDMPLHPSGTAFQQSVWTALQDIPFGTTVSYRTLAERLNRPTSFRAVAQAIGANPIAIIVPCHRVIGSNGSLTGFAGGLVAKRTLLELENVAIL